MDVLAVWCGMMCGTRASDDHNKFFQDNVIVPLTRTIHDDSKKRWLLNFDNRNVSLMEINWDRNATSTIANNQFS